MKGTQTPPDGRRGTPHRRTNQHNIVQLKCGHVLIFYSSAHCPKRHELAWCFRCEVYSAVTVSPAGLYMLEFNARCRNCRAAKRAGANRFEAERFADGHAFRKSHIVDVFQDEETLEPLSTFGPQSETLDLGDVAI
jgi:hypothetical protein